VKKKQRAFSLVETLISLMIGLVVVAGATRLAMVQSHDIAHRRAMIDTRAALTMASEELRLRTRGLERPFFTKLPLKPGIDLVHRGDHDHGAVQLTERCPQNRANGCLIWWDLIPPEEDPIVYEMIIDEDWDRFGLIAVEPSIPAGLPETIGPMSVLLIAGPTGSICQLVAAVENGEVVLAPESDQPWPRNVVITAQQARVVHLGRLEVVHCGLSEHKGIGNRLTYHPWTVGEDGWRAGRGRTSHGHLAGLIWSACEEGRPDRLVLLARPERARILGVPVVIAGRRFDREVLSASLYF